MFLAGTSLFKMSPIYFQLTQVQAGLCYVDILITDDTVLFKWWLSSGKNVNGDAGEWRHVGFRVHFWFWTIWLVLWNTTTWSDTPFPRQVAHSYLAGVCPRLLTYSCWIVYIPSTLQCLPQVHFWQACNSSSFLVLLTTHFGWESQTGVCESTTDLTTGSKPGCFQGKSLRGHRTQHFPESIAWQEPSLVFGKTGVFHPDLITSILQLSSGNDFRPGNCRPGSEPVRCCNKPWRVDTSKKFFFFVSFKASE